MTLAERVVDSYSKVASEVGATVATSPLVLMKAVATHVNSLSELTKKQMRNLIKFLERPDISPLVKVDGIRLLTMGPACGRMGSATLIRQLATALPLIDECDQERKERLRELRYILSVDRLPTYLAHRDSEVVAAAKKRLAYIESFPERREALIRCMQKKAYERKRDALIKAANEKYKLLAKVGELLPKEGRERDKRRAEQLLDVSGSDEQTVLEFERGDWNDSEY